MGRTRPSECDGAWRPRRRGPPGALPAIASAVTLIVSTVALVAVALAAAAPAAYAARSAALIVDANTGRMLHEEDADALRYPASLTKVMTLYLVFEAIREGRLSYASRIKISAHAASEPPSNIDLEEGDTLSVADAVKALVTKSANDVAAALAEHLAGSVEKFAERMTRKAREIGMPRTVFRNASGLPDSEQVTTARDMVTLGMRLQDDFPEDYKLFQTERFTYQGRSYSNHNTLLRTYEGIDGIKTGYTRASGFNLLSSARRGGRHVVGVVFGGATAGLRNQRMRYLLATAMRRAATKRTRAMPPHLIARPRPAGRPARVAVSAAREPKPQAAPAAAFRSKPSAAAQVAGAATPRPAMQPAGPARSAVAAMDSPALTDLAAKAMLATHAAPTIPGNGDGTPGATTGSSISIARVRTTPVIPVAPVSTPLPREPAATSAAIPTASTRMAFAAPSMRDGVRAPSTLDAQAARLGGNAVASAQATSSGAAMPPPSALGGPVAGSVQIQIGAYNSSGEAEKALAAAKTKAGGLLDRASGYALPVGGGKSMVRARFGGFDAASATSTCLELRRKSIDCFVTR